MRINLVFILFAALSSTNATASDLLRPSEDGNDWYFNMGGGDPYVNYRQTNRTTLDLNVGVEWSAFRGCTFDPRASIIDTLKDAKQSINGFAEDIVSAAPMLAASWGLSKLQENYPGAYDLITKGLADAKGSFVGAVKSCRDMQSDLANGRDPTNGWVRFSRKASWDAGAQTGDNPVRVEQKLDADAAKRGIAWVGGKKKGGTGQEPILVVGDTIDAAYAHVTKDQTGSESTNVSGDGRITRVFANSTAAAKWTTSVIGESTIRMCPDCDRLSTKMGQGLRLKHREERDAIDKDLADALKAPKITNDALNRLSAPGMGIVATEDVLRGLREAPPSEQGILANRFASELALARVTEKALIARDLLNVGTQEPNIAANETAIDQLTTARDRLDRELNNILYEQEVKSKVITNASKVLTERGQARDARPAGQDLQRPSLPLRDVKDGGINQ